jgi:hypothetical protein
MGFIHPYYRLFTSGIESKINFPLTIRSSGNCRGLTTLQHYFGSWRILIKIKLLFFHTVFSVFFPKAF